MPVVLLYIKAACSFTAAFRVHPCDASVQFNNRREYNHIQFNTLNR